MLQSAKIGTTSLGLVFYFSSELTSCSRNYTFSKKTGIEILSIQLKATKSTWLKLYNVYLPNTPTQYASFDPSLLKPGPSSFILGNVNGHSEMWHYSQLQVQRGDEILDWILDNNLHILNDGSATRTSRITDNDSTPGISLCGSNWSAKTSWRLVEPLGSCDHFPIIIERAKMCKPKSAVEIASVKRSIKITRSG